MKQLIILFYISIFLACSKNSNENENYFSLIDQGWQEFERADYNSAMQSFMKAKEEDNSKYEAYMGLAWAMLLNPEITTFNDALINSNTAVNKHGNHTDALAAQAFSMNFTGNYSGSNSSIEKLLSIDSKWVFTRNTRVDVSKLLLLSSQNYFFIADYSKSLNLVITLNPDFSANINTQEGIFKLQNEIERLNPGL